MISRDLALRAVRKHGLLELIPDWEHDDERPFGYVYLTVNVSAYRERRKPIFYIGQRKLPKSILSIDQDRYKGSNRSLLDDQNRGDVLERFTICHANDASVLTVAERVFCEAMEVGVSQDFYNRNNRGGGGGERAAQLAADTRRAKAAGTYIAPETSSQAFTRFAVRTIPVLLCEAGRQLATQSVDHEIRSLFTSQNEWDDALDAPMKSGAAKIMWRYLLINARAQLSRHGVIAKGGGSIVRLIDQYDCSEVVVLGRRLRSKGRMEATPQEPEGD
jgi:hypothetical protein